MTASPENTFTNATCSRKESMSTNLLGNDTFLGSGKFSCKVSTIERYKSLNCDDTITEMHANERSRAGLGSSNEAICSEPIGGDANSVAATNADENDIDYGRGKCDSIDKRVPSPLDDDMDVAEMTECNLTNRKAGGYLIAVHRKLSRQDTYFLSYHKSRPSLFGVPLLIPCYEDGTNKDLYCAVWIQVARLLSPLPSTPPDQSNHATDW